MTKVVLDPSLSRKESSLLAIPDDEKLIESELVFEMVEIGHFDVIEDEK